MEKEKAVCSFSVPSDRFEAIADELIAWVRQLPSFPDIPVRKEKSYDTYHNETNGLFDALSLIDELILLHFGS